MAEAELFYKNKRKFDELSKENESEEIELSLGLSLNGRFGIDPNRPDNESLVRSSSVANFTFSGGGGAEADTVKIKIETMGLGRAVSLPAATEEDWRRRKEVQSIRRMEARRKRVEKMKIGGVRIGRDRLAIGDLDGQMGDRHMSIGSNSSGSAPKSSECEPPDEVTNQVIANYIPVEARSPNENEQKQTLPIGGTNTEQQSTTTSTNETKETMKNMMVDMPCVSTRGDGSSGKRIEGFLYRYKKGEEVVIVCVCHGNFLSPAEFVKHAGGGDVSHPMKHIVVNPSPLM